MSDMELYEGGFADFMGMLAEIGQNVSEENVMKALEAGAKEFTEDVRALPQRRSRVSTPGYTHLIDTVTYQRSRGEVVTGWGKYYGPMVEGGTIKMREGTPHMDPTYQRNTGKYQKTMGKVLFG